jgi:hypothetical protein
VEEKVAISFSRICQFVLISVLSLAVVFPQSLFAQDHVVSPAQLEKDVQDASAARERNVAQLDDLFSSEQGQKALQTVHVNYQRVQKAVRSLSDEDLARFAARAQNARNDFAAGNITTTDLLWIVLGVLVVILIIVAVRH